MGGASSDRISDDSKLMDFIKTLDPATRPNRFTNIQDFIGEINQ